MNTDAIIYNKLIDPLLKGLRSLIKSKIKKDTSLIDIASGTGELVMSLSGHSSLEHLQKYIHYVDERKKNAVDKFPELAID